MAEGWVYMHCGINPADVFLKRTIFTQGNTKFTCYVKTWATFNEESY